MDKQSTVYIGLVDEDGFPNIKAMLAPRKWEGIKIWGTTFISTKLLLTDFSPVEILFCRFALGLLALLIAYPHRFGIKEKNHELTFAAAGLCGIHGGNLSHQL